MRSKFSMVEVGEDAEVARFCVLPSSEQDNNSLNCWKSPFLKVKTAPRHNTAVFQPKEKGNISNSHQVSKLK